MRRIFSGSPYPNYHLCAMCKWLPQYSIILLITGESLRALLVSDIFILSPQKILLSQSSFSFLEVQDPGLRSMTTMERSKVSARRTTLPKSVIDCYILPLDIRRRDTISLNVFLHRCRTRCCYEPVDDDSIPNFDLVCPPLFHRSRKGP